MLVENRNVNQKKCILVDYYPMQVYTWNSLDRNRTNRPTSVWLHFSSKIRFIILLCRCLFIVECLNEQFIYFPTCWRLPTIPNETKFSNESRARFPCSSSLAYVYDFPFISGHVTRLLRLHSHFR